MTKDFQARQRRIRTCVKKSLRGAVPMEDLLEASIVCALVQLLDRIYREDGEIDLADLNTASGVIQRLLGSIQQVTELRMRARDLATESTERGAGFSEEIRLRIEERLKLL